MSKGSTDRHVRCGLLASLALMVAMPVFAQVQRPNVVFILADNVGYGDLGPYGGGELRGAPTPRRGLRFRVSVSRPLHSITDRRWPWLPSARPFADRRPTVAAALA